LYIHILVPWPDGDPGSGHVIQLFAKSVLVVTDNTDRYYENFSIFEDNITIIPTYASFGSDST